MLASKKRKTERLVVFINSDELVKSRLESMIVPSRRRRATLVLEFGTIGTPLAFDKCMIPRKCSASSNESAT